MMFLFIVFILCPVLYAIWNGLTENKRQKKAMRVRINALREEMNECKRRGKVWVVSPPK